MSLCRDNGEGFYPALAVRKAEKWQKLDKQMAPLLSHAECSEKRFTIMSHGP